jgi:hypothetical protein
MANITPAPEILLAQAAELPVGEVEALRDFAMTYVRGHARQVVADKNARAHRFVLLDESGGQVGSDEVDTYLSVSVSKRERLQRMRVSFLELILSEERRYSNSREVYYFDWQPDGVVYARRRVIDIFGRIISTGLNEEGLVEDLVIPEIVDRTFPIAVADCDALCDRMLAVTESVRQKAA